MEFNQEFLWSSDWMGDEVGFPESEVVGLYSSRENPNQYFYIDMESLDILEEWEIDDDE
jgi:hypothetical protein